MLTRKAPLKRSAWPRKLKEQPAREERPQVTLVPLARPPNYAAPANDPVRAIPKTEFVRSEAYRKLVAAMPCAHCGIAGHSQHAHANEGKGKNLKTHDIDGFPLCCDRPGIEGCHPKFDQYRLVDGGREAHRALARTWGDATAAAIVAAGAWPAGLAQKK